MRRAVWLPTQMCPVRALRILITEGIRSPRTRLEREGFPDTPELPGFIYNRLDRRFWSTLSDSNAVKPLYRSGHHQQCLECEIY